MNKKIDFSKPVAELARDDPEFIEVMKELGFTDIASPVMLNTAGRIMTIPKGAAMRGIDLETIKRLFIAKGYRIESKEEQT